MIKQIKKLVPNNLKKNLRLFLHKGNRYHCPLCGYKAKDLYPIGLEFPVLFDKQIIGGGRRNAGCLKCGSSDRERLIFIFLKEKMGLFAGPKSTHILHIAPEKQLTKFILAEGFQNYVCGDLFSDGYLYPEHVQNMNVLALPFPENTFDLVICNHVLEHIPDDRLAMSEIYRVLKGGGKAILQVPISNISESTFEDFSVSTAAQREIVFGQFDHIRIYGQDYTERLKEVGFKVNRMNISEEYSQYGVNPLEDLFIGEK
jgi:SAM-dependent methyltransferase